MLALSLQSAWAQKFPPSQKSAYLETGVLAQGLWRRFLNFCYFVFAKGYFVSSIVEIGPVVLEKTIYLLLEKGLVIHLNKFVPSMVEIGPVVLERKMKI